MAIRFIIDSASDILPQQAQELGLIQCPLKVRFGNEEFADAIDLTHMEFYEKLVESDVFPTTSQVTPAEFEAAYKEVTNAGDTAIVITISSKLSGTYQSAVIAAEGYEGKVFVFDSLNVSLGARILILRALELRDQGLSVEAILEKLNEEKQHIKVIALLDTLEYLKKGGRISAATAIAGSILSIKPVIAVADGEVVLIGKARGSKQCNNLLRELALQGGGIDFDKPLCLAYSGLSDSMLQKYIRDSADLWEAHTDKLPVATIGCVIGAHAGPGALAFAFFEK